MAGLTKARARRIFREKFPDLPAGDRQARPPRLSEKRTARRGHPRFTYRFNNRGSLCAAVFEWLIRCLQPSGPAHNAAARGNFATPSVSILSFSSLRPRAPWRPRLTCLFPLHSPPGQLLALAQIHYTVV